MRHCIKTFVRPIFGLALLLVLPARIEAQGRPGFTTVHTLTAVVPSIVRYVVDATTQNADGSPTIRVITNDPAIRAAFARGVTPELIPGALASTTPEQSGHAKGGGAAEGTTAAPNVLRYTLVAP